MEGLKLFVTRGAPPTSHLFLCVALTGAPPCS